MHIVNMMLGRGRGGIEQACIDYAEGLQQAGVQVSVILRPAAAITPEIASRNIPIYTLPHWGAWDPFAPHRLRRILSELKPTTLIAHGNRAVEWGHKAAEDLCPVVGVAHNYILDHVTDADAVFAITPDIAQKVTALGMPSENVFLIPNMVRINASPQHRKRQSPPVIGSMGRFVEKKGFHYFLEALAHLKKRGVAFKAILGGNGDEEKRLREQIQVLHLGKDIAMPGWIGDKAKFFTELDIFCLPSLHEPFGIVLLEAAAAKLPIVTTDSEGPASIITPGENAIMIPKGNAHAMADALEKLIRDEVLANHLAENAYRHVAAHYAMPVVTARILAALEKLAPERHFLSQHYDRQQKI